MREDEIREIATEGLMYSKSLEAHYYLDTEKVERLFQKILDNLDKDDD